MSDLVELDAVVITDQLKQRPTRASDLAAENRALASLGPALAASPSAMLQVLADVSLELCHAESVVISLEDDDRLGFSWRVVAGQWAPYHAHRLPRDASPCGIVEARGAAQLFSRPERCFAAMTLATPVADEMLVAPILVRGECMGALWLVAHNPYRHFDTEDVRIATDLAGFASAAYALMHPEHPEPAFNPGIPRVDAARRDLFLATLAHELRNPLAPVMNSLEIMRRAGGEPLVLRDAIATMQRQMAQMVRMVDDLVDVSRITRDQLELRRARVALGPVISGAVEACEPLAIALDHEVRVELPEDAVYVDADPIRLTQILGNLLNNACKFTDRGGRIEVSVKRLNGDVEVRVKDNGVGIASDQLSAVFEMFAHVDHTTGKPQAGLGIGLHLVKRLVELHGGTVRATSEGRGRGSEFIVHLPIAVDAPRAKKSNSSVSSETSPATPRRRILVVDDNHDAAMSLAVLLKVSGHDTEMAADGVEALQKASIYRPDVILLDISLPRMNGYDTCRAMREQAWGRNAVIVALTGWGQDEDRSKSKDAGFNGHFVKPVDHAELMKFLSETSAG